MNKLQETSPFYPGSRGLSVIITDLTESEALIHQMAQDTQRERPEDFAGKSPCVYYKMPYVPPYEPFRELRQLILCIRERTGLRANFQGVVAIEVTQWLGHEKEEYFSVFLKYLYDHRDLWQAALVLNVETESQTQRFLSACAVYMSPRFFDLCLFSQRERIQKAVRRECELQGKFLTRDAAETLAEALVSPQFRHARSLSLIQRTVGELTVNSPSSGIVTEDAVLEYLADPHSLLAMIAGKTPSDERSKVNASERLQL